MNEYNKSPGILLGIDFKKAFDFIEWDFIYAVLTKFNFGEIFINMIKTLYKNISSATSNNGHISQYFSLSRGVRQGDPLYLYIFIIVAEIMAIQIRNNPLIKGLKFGSNECKLLQYADDTTAIVADVVSAKIFIECVQIYGEYSGLLINKEKTMGMWLGSHANKTEKPLGIIWPDDHI